MKTIYILLTRSGTLLSNLVYAVTGANYTHASLAFDEDLSCLYSSTRKNGYTMFPAGPSREYLNRGVFRLRENVPCALYALDVSDEAYTRARRRAEHMMAHGRLYQFNVIGLALCGMHIRWKRRRHYFCSQFVSEVLEKSGAMELPKHSTLMHPNDYTRLEELRCVYKGTLAGLPQRQQMEFHRLPAFRQVPQVLEALLQIPQGGVVHGAVKLLAVAGDEGNGVALVQKADHVFHMAGVFVQLRCQLLNEILHGL